MTRVRNGSLALALFAAALTIGGAEDAAAQAAPAGQASRPFAIEGAVGWAGFLDEAIDHHGLFGGALRLPLGRRLSVGPEVVVAHGDHGHDTFVLGSLWIDLGPDPARARVVPYLVVGGGYMWFSQRFGGARFTSGEGSFTAGGGARIHVTDRVYVGGEARLGWEPHLRIAGVVGATWPAR